MRNSLDVLKVMETEAKARKRRSDLYNLIAVGTIGLFVLTLFWFPSLSDNVQNVIVIIAKSIGCVFAGAICLLAVIFIPFFYQEFVNGLKKGVLHMKSIPQPKKIVLSAIIIALLFIVFVWPTLWRRDNVRIGERWVLIRTNRITGSVQQFGLGDGWRDVGR